jgi:hypothetical protein
MAAQANGRAKKPKKSASNGTLNGSLNGHMNGHADKTQSSGPVARSSGQRKPRRTMTGAATSMVARYVLRRVVEAHGLLRIHLLDRVLTIYSGW